jgi:ribosomal protein S18 acetylase RimI-like enzyme
MTTSLDGFDCASLLMGFGRDVGTFLSASSPAGVFRIDDHGWLGLTGEPGSADLNMAAVVGSASPGVVDDYVDAVEERGVNAILFLGDDAPHLVEAALARGLTAAGEVPMMVWRHDTLVSTRTRSARQVTENEISAANAVVADAFSLDEDAVQRTMPPSLLARGADVWIVEEDGAIAGSGTFVRSGDHVGIYCMATGAAFQRQGVGRAVLETAMAHYLEHGATTFTLGATAAGLRLYEQIGFETVASAPALVIGASTQFSN